MADIPPILVQIQADVAQLKAGLTQAEAALKGLDKNVDDTSKGFARFTDRLKQVGATLGVTFAATQVVQFFQNSIKAAMEAEAAQVRLREILLTTGGATEAQVIALNAQAEALSKVGVASKENITITQSQLATFDLQGKTINKLTPAILDYVVAEKGATASAEDYKQMTNGLAQALNGNFASLTRIGFVLDDETKKKIKSGTESERAAALVKVLNSTYEDFNKTLLDTPEGRAIKLKQEFEDLQQEIGSALLPVFMKFSSFLKDTVIPTVEKILKFIKDNKTEIKAFAITLAVGATAWGVYTAAVNRAKIAQAALNLVQKANPIGILITAVGLLVAGIVKLWKSSETFRSVVINMAKVALNAFASIIPMVARVFEAIMKINTGPMRLFLTALSKIPGVGKLAQAGLDAINKGLNGISDYGDKAAKKAKELSAGLDRMAKQSAKTREELDKTGKSAADVWAGSKDPKGAMSADEKRALDKIKSLQKKANDVLKDMAEARAEATEAIAEAELVRDERIAEARERYAETIANAQKRRDEAEIDAKERLTEQVLDITKDYNRKRLEAEKTYNERVRDLQMAAEKKRQEITLAGQAKLAEIVERGRERLRSAWESGTAFSLADLFKKAAEGGGSVLDVLRAQLNQTRTFQEGIAELAGKGYTQTFIEQIAKAGPAVGMEMLEQLRSLTPDQEAELKRLYASLEETTTTGVNEIANQLSTTTKFATAELKAMYDQAQTDIAAALAEVNSELNTNVAEAKATYEAALAEAALVRDEKLAEAKEALNKALAEAAKTYNESLAEAQKDLNKAIEDAMKSFEKAVDKINDNLDKKLLDLREKLAQIMSDLAALNAASASLALGLAVGGGGGGGGGGEEEITISSGGKKTTTKKPTVKKTTSPDIDTAPHSLGKGNISVTQNITTTKADPHEIARASLSAIRFGQTVITNTTPIPTKAGVATYSTKATSMPATVRGVPVTRAK